MSHVVLAQKARNRNLASVNTFLEELGFQRAHLANKTHSCDWKAPLPPVSDVLEELILDVFDDTHWAPV